MAPIVYVEYFTETIIELVKVNTVFIFMYTVIKH